MSLRIRLSPRVCLVGKADRSCVCSARAHGLDMAWSRSRTRRHVVLCRLCLLLSHPRAALDVRTGADVLCGGLKVTEQVPKCK